MITVDNALINVCCMFSHYLSTSHETGDGVVDHGAGGVVEGGAAAHVAVSMPGTAPNL